jgi:hypothetical protein
MHRLARTALHALALVIVACGGGPAAPPATAARNAADVKGSIGAELAQSLAGSQRTDTEKKRDAFRHQPR